MFEQSILKAPARKQWTVAVSLVGQALMIGFCMLTPLIHIDALPRAHFFRLSPLPVTGVHRPAKNPTTLARTTPRQWTKQVITEPSRIPARAAIIHGPDLLSTGPEIEVTDGLGAPNAPVSTVLADVVRLLPSVPLPLATKPPKPTAPTRLKVGGVVQTAMLIHGPRPVYPQLAKQARVSGVVRLEAIISKHGKIVNLRVVSGHPLLVRAAMETVRQWIYRPTMLNAEPVEVMTEIDVNFTLQP